MGDHLVRFAQDEPIENLPLTPRKLRDPVSCLPHSLLHRPSGANSPAFNRREKAPGKFTLKKCQSFCRPLSGLPLGLQRRQCVRQFARSHVHYQFQTMLDHLPVGDIANHAEQ